MASVWTKLKSILNQNNLLLGLSVVIKFLALGVSILITRWQNNYFDPQTLKDFNLTLAYLAIIMGVISFGIPQIIYKYFTNETDEKKLADFWATMLWVRVASYFFGLAVILLTLRLSGVNNFLLIFGIFSAQFILLADQSFRSVVDSRDKSLRFSATDLFSKVALTGVLYLGVKFFFGQQQVLGLFILSALIIYTITYLLDQIINSEFIGKGKFQWSILKTNHKSLIYLALPGLFFVNSYDRIFLQYFQINAYIINGYSNAVKIFEVSLIVPSLIIPVLVSRLQQRTKNLPLQDFNLHKNKYLIYLAILSIGYALVLYIFAPVIFGILDPTNQYSKYSIQVIGWFCLALLLNFFNLFYYNLNISNHREKFEVVYYYLTSLFLLIGLFTFTKFFGYIGGGIAFATSASLDFLARSFIFKYRKTDNV